jgi:tetratricopeptide (TPR) repeat protein
MLQENKENPQSTEKQKKQMNITSFNDGKISIAFSHSGERDIPFIKNIVESIKIQQTDLPVGMKKKLIQDQVVVQYGLEMYKDGKYNDAIEFLLDNPTEKDTVNESFSFFLLANSYYSLGDCLSAIKYFNELLVVAPYFADMHDIRKHCAISHFISMALFRFDSVENAINKLNSSGIIHTKYYLKNDPFYNSDDLLYSVIIDDGDEPKVVSSKLILKMEIEHLKAKADKNPNSFEYVCRLANLYQLGWDIENAILCYDNAIALTSNEMKVALLNCAKAMTYREYAKHDEALALFGKMETSIELLPDNIKTDYFIFYGTCCLDVGMSEKGIEVVSRITEHTSATYSLLARLSMSGGELKSGMSWCEKALEKDSTNLEARLNLGYLLLLIGETSKAEKHFLTAIEIDKEYWLSYYNFGMYYLLKDDKSLPNAMDCFSKSIKLNSNVKSKVMYATCLIDNGKTLEEYEEAIILLSNVLECDHENADANIKYVQACVKTNKIDEAVRALNLIDKSSSFGDMIVHECVLSLCKIEISKSENKHDKVWSECQNILCAILGSDWHKSIENGSIGVGAQVVSIINYKKYYFIALRELLLIARRRNHKQYNFYTQLMSKSRLILREYYEKNDDCWVWICNKEINDDAKFIGIIEEDFQNSQEIEYYGTASAKRDSYLARKRSEDNVRQILEDSLKPGAKPIQVKAIDALKKIPLFSLVQGDLAEYLMSPDRDNFMVYVNELGKYIELWYVQNLRQYLSDKEMDRNKCFFIVSHNDGDEGALFYFLVKALKIIQKNGNKIQDKSKLDKLKKHFDTKATSENYTTPQKFTSAKRTIAGRIGYLLGEANATTGRMKVGEAKKIDYSKELFEGSLDRKRLIFHINPIDIIFNA